MTIRQDIRRRYGAHPAHVVLIGGLGVVVVLAVRRMLQDQYGVPHKLAEWVVGGAVLHDAVLVPAYVGLDAVVVRIWRRHPGAVPWINHIRIPAGISAVLLLVYIGEIARRNTAQFDYSTGRSDTVYLPHWLFVTAVLFALSALSYLLRVGRHVRRTRTGA